MKLHTIATSLILASFLAVAVTGLLIFFKLSVGLIRPFHEITGLIFVIGSLLHIILHWKQIILLLKKPFPLILVIIFVVLTLIAVIAPADRHPQRTRKSLTELDRADTNTIINFA